MGKDSYAVFDAAYFCSITSRSIFRFIQRMTRDFPLESWKGERIALGLIEKESAARIEKSARPRFDALLFRFDPRGLRVFSALAMAFVLLVGSDVANAQNAWQWTLRIYSSPYERPSDLIESRTFSSRLAAEEYLWQLSPEYSTLREISYENGSYYYRGRILRAIPGRTVYSSVFHDTAAGITYEKHDYEEGPVLEHQIAHATEHWEQWDGCAPQIDVHGWQPLGQYENFDKSFIELLQATTTRNTKVNGVCVPHPEHSPRTNGIISRFKICRMGYVEPEVGYGKYCVYPPEFLNTPYNELSHTWLKNPHPNFADGILGVRSAHFAKLSGRPNYCSPARGNPCEVSTGVKRETFHDTNGYGELDVIRHYSSAGGSSEIFGRGWSSRFDYRFLANGNAGEFVSPEGISTRFLGDSIMGTYLSKDNPNATLKVFPESETSRSIVYLDGRAYSFNARGKLSSIDFRDGNILRASYDVYARLEAISFKGRDIHFNYIGEDKKASSIVLPNGLAIFYHYDTAGRLEKVTYPDGLVEQYGYKPETSLLQSVVDAWGEKTYEYDENYRLARSLNHGSVYEYIYSQNQTVIIDPLGGRETIGFETGTLRRPVSHQINGASQIATLYSGSTLSWSRRDSETNRVIETQRSAYTDIRKEHVGGVLYRQTQTTYTNDFSLPSTALVSKHTQGADPTDLTAASWTYNARGQVLRFSKTDSIAGSARSTTKVYCEQPDIDAGTCPLPGLVTSVDDTRTDVSDVTTYIYRMADAPGCDTEPITCQYRKGDLWKVTNTLGQVTEILRYDVAGRPLSVKDLNGAITDYEYHPRGWLMATKARGPDDNSEADDRTTHIEYWPTGLVKKVTQPDGAFTTYGYDAAHRLTTIGDNAGNTLTYTLDNAGNRIQEETRDDSGTLRRTLSRLYNQLGQLTTQADAGNNPTDFTYDPNGNLKTVTDPLARQTANDYDPLNRLVRTLQDVGGIEAETTFEYDALDHLTRVTDPKGLETGYTYNAFGDLLQLDSPDTGTTTYTYDSGGNRTGQVDARGQASSYAYDALNRLTGIGYAGASDQDVAYVYDTVQPACEPGETFSIGRLSAMADASGSTQYCYDRFGQLVRKVQVTNGQTFTLRYAYTQSGQLSRLTYPDGSAADYVRDAQGRVTEVGVTSPGGGREVLLTGAGYAPFGPATGWTYGNGRTLNRTHDLDYRPESILDSAAGGLDFGYSYDPAGNLTALRTADLAEPPRARFEYDALSRLTAFKDGAAGATIEGYAYDATGNRTGFINAGGSQNYAYPTGSHRLTSIAGVARAYDAAGNTTAIGASKEFVYNAANRLSEVKQGGTVTIHYVYNGKGERVRRHLGANDVTTVYDEAGRWLGDYDATSTPIQQAVWLDDNPVGLLVGAAGINRFHYVQPDHLGTPRSVIDPIRNVAVWSWDLASEAFGNSPPNRDPDNDGTNFVFDMRLPGQRYDAASGLNYNYFRDYEPGTGRYPQSDPIGLSGGVSTFAYVSADPFGQYDPYGLEGPGSWTNPPPPDPAYAVAWPILRSTYREMLNKNVRGTDQFFHCLAACRATKQTGTPKIVLEIMANKENRDYVLNILGRYGERKLSHGEMLADMARDRAVNEMGAACPPEVDCKTRCGPLLDTLPETHRKFMLDYRPDWR